LTITTTKSEKDRLPNHGTNVCLTDTWLCDRWLYPECSNIPTTQRLYPQWNAFHVSFIPI